MGGATGGAAVDMRVSVEGRWSEGLRELGGDVVRLARWPARRSSASGSPRRRWSSRCRRRRTGSVRRGRARTRSTTPSCGRALMRQVPRLWVAGYGRRRERPRGADGARRPIRPGVGVLAHRHVVRVIVEVDVRHRQAELVDGRRRSSVTRLVSWGMSSPTSHMPAMWSYCSITSVNRRAPGARVDERGEERRPERERLHVVAADEAAVGVVARLVGDDPRHRLAAVHVHGLVERGVHRSREVAHVVASDLAAGVGQPVRVQARLGDQQQPRRLDGVAGHETTARPAGAVALPSAST